MKKILNLTPHDVNIVDEKGNNIVTFPKGETCPRLIQKTVKHSVINGIQITETQFGELKNMPEEKEDTMYIVSRLVMGASIRKDLLVPNQIVRDSSGNIKGCKSLSKN